MTIHVPIKEAKNRFSELTRFAERGETVVITRNGQPVADLKPHQPKKGFDAEALKQWKIDRGYRNIAGPAVGNFDDPLDADVLIKPLR